jgi:hypothetical protein
MCLRRERERERERERRNERKKARRVRVNEKLPIFAALRKERDPIFVFESGREKEREREEKTSGWTISLSISRAFACTLPQVKQRTGMIMFVQNQICIFPWWCWFFLCRKMSRSILLFTTLSLSLCVYGTHTRIFYYTKRSRFKTALGANAFVKTVLCAHTRYSKSPRGAPRTRLVHQCTSEFRG